MLEICGNKGLYWAILKGHCSMKQKVCMWDLSVNEVNKRSVSDWLKPYTRYQIWVGFVNHALLHMCFLFFFLGYML